MSTVAAPRPFATGRRSEDLVALAAAAAVLAASLAQLSHGGSGIGALRPGSLLDPSHRASATFDVGSVVLVACSTLPLAVWRRSPFAVFTVTAAANVLLAARGHPLDLTLGPAIALYLLAASREQQAPWIQRTTVTVVGLFVAYLAAATAATETFPEGALLHSGLAWAVAWFAGERTRLRREHIAELQERARRTERDAERERLLAAAEERARIARDLHDSAGHAISVIAVRAGAARLGHHQDADRSLVALEAIEDLARQTAEEIDHIVGNLRRGDPATGAVEAPSGLAALDTLVAHHATTGLAVSLHTSGTPRTLAGPADQAAYRILQEALTNAARHGTGCARIDLAFGDVAVELAVTNPLPADGAPRDGGGHGLIGMHERATLLGGTLHAGRADGGFRVHARIPYGGRA